MNHSKISPAQDNSKSSDTTGIRNYNTSILEEILFPHMQEISSVNSVTTPTSSGYLARATPKTIESCIMPMNGKKHMMEEVENARQWFCNTLCTGNDRAYATAVHDAAFTQMYLSLAEKKFLKDGIRESNDATPSLLKLDKKILNSNYTKSELASLYENHRQRTKQKPKEMKCRKKQSRVSPSEPSVCPLVSSADTLGLEGSTTDLIVGKEQDGVTPNGAAEISGESSATDQNLCAAETIKTIVEHEIACGGAPSSQSSVENTDDTTLHDRSAHKREVAAAKKIASKAICRRNPPQSIESMPKKCDKQNETTDINHDELSIVNKLAELHSHTRIIKTTNDKTSDFDTLVFDPSFLTQENGLPFLELADSLVPKHSNLKNGFLSTPPLKLNREITTAGTKMAYYPAWIKSDKSSKEEESKSIFIPFYLLLLAKIEIAIWGAYYRYKQSNRSETSVDDISHTLQKASKLQLLGEKVGLEKRQQIMKPVISSLQQSKVHQEIKLSHDCQLENLLIVPFSWCKSQKSDESKHSFVQLLQKLYHDLNSSHPELKEPSSTPECEIDDIALSIADEITTKSKKKKKKKSKKKTASTQTKPMEVTSSEPVTNKTNEPKPEKVSPAITLQRVDGGATCVVVEPKNDTDESSTPSEQWERVESKTRASRKQGKAPEETPKTKPKTRTPASRRRPTTRKLVKDILCIIVDEACAEAEKRKKKIEEKKPKERKLGVSSLRDIVMANLKDSLPEKKVKHAEQPKNDIFKDRKQPYLSRKPSTGSSKYNISNTDQNTAPTLPETLSGISSNIVEVEKKDSPPLLTLHPNPQNPNSAASSVASSLEAIHTPSGQDPPLTEKDVGYHLLNVCERLSNDMAKFMNRRALALGARRRERGALLSSLQETVTKIWSGRSHVEMYGSCATQLDLPSSDLDLVICGLSQPKNKHKGRKSDYYDDPNVGLNQHAINAGRIIRLASELERQPFAVQVKAIPTASVPVLKMLADASRIPSGNESDGEYSGTGDWMGGPAVSQQIHQSQISPGNDVMYGGSTYPHPWRGADCMNGLLKVDITFEGPEHGGIGSTAYAAKVIEEHCKETGLPAEATPVAQLIMALKELLAQRRLNEPFSGGLSSYALILMVVAIMRERKAIKAEMELAERQRRAVASASATNQRNYANKASSADSLKPAVPKNAIPAVSTKAKKDAESSTDTSSSQTGAKVSSWASVAKKGKPVRPKSDKKPTTKPPPTPEPTPEKTTNQSLTKLNHQTSTCTNDSQANSTNSKPTPTSSSVTASSSFGVSQGSNDVLEVLCSGEPTAGKLLMHFLLFYGKLFDSMTMAIDVTAPDNGKGPFVPRQAGGTIDPFTGMLTVDPIVVFDPLEGAESNNVARSCFAWQSVKWVFGQCFSTLTHTMERRSRGNSSDDGSEVSPLLELILSY